MRSSLRHAFFGLVVLCLSVSAERALAADNLPIDAFFGKFVGSGIARSDVSDYFGLTVRDLDVTIAGAGGGAVAITWTTVIRQGGDPDNPDIRKKSAQVILEPIRRRQALRNDALYHHPRALASRLDCATFRDRRPSLPRREEIP